jgi:hypothetical protein
MTTVTGNPERDRMIFASMKAATLADEILSLDNLKARLPKDFDLRPAELVACRHVAKLDSPAAETAEGESKPWYITEAAPEPLAVREAAAQPEPQAASVVVERQQPEVRLIQAQARAAVESAAKRLDLARLAVRMARSALDVQRGRLSKAIEAWQNGGPKWTDAMEREQMRASYLANKRSGPRMNTRKHPAQAVIEGRGVVSGYKGSHRNGLPSEMQHRNVATPAMFQGGIAKKI